MSDKSQDERFLRLLMENRGAIYAYTLSKVHNQSDADDIMQDAVTLMWRKFAEFEPGTNFVGWGISFSRNLVMKYFDKRRRSRLRFSDNVIEDIENRIKTKLQHDEAGRRLEALKGCVKKLDKNDLHLIQMRYTEKMSARSISDIADMSIHKIYRTMIRIHKSLEMCVRRTITEKA